MKKRLVLAAAAILAAQAQAQLVINEFNYDDTGTDTHWFVEIYNAGGSPVDISGYRVIGVDNTGTLATPDNAYTVPAATTLAAGDYYVVGTAAVPNVDQSTASTGTGDFQNDMEALALLDPADAIIDSVVYERNKANIVILAGLGEPAFDGVSATSGGGIWMNTTVVEAAVTNTNGFTTGTSFNSSIAYGRNSDGVDTNNNELDFGMALATPGAANNSAGSVTLPYTNNFDGAVDTVIYDFAGNYTNGHIKDPAVAETLTGAYPSSSKNPSVIPASPQGGNVLTVWDDTGGGNSGIINLAAPVANVAVETYFYVPAPLTATDSEISEPVIIRGHADAAANTLPNALGTVGIHFRVLNNTTGTATPTNDGDVSIEVNQVVNGVITNFGSVDGVSAGWTRLYLSANGTAVTAVIGGTYGSGTSTGTVITGTTTITRAGGIGFNYRESAATNTNARPLTYDAFRIEAVSSVEDWNISE